jgi:hypothetical protein
VDKVLRHQPEHHLNVLTPNEPNIDAGAYSYRRPSVHHDPVPAPKPQRLPEDVKPGKKILSKTLNAKCRFLCMNQFTSNRVSGQVRVGLGYKFFQMINMSKGRGSKLKGRNLAMSVIDNYKFTIVYLLLYKIDINICHISYY